jgi:hypothetical protein
MVMEKIEKFIEENWDKFSNLECSEVVEYTDLNEFDSEIIDYLKSFYRFDYKGIYVYLVEKFWLMRLYVFRLS